MFSTEFLSPKTVEALKILEPFVENFYLAGGTALSMYYLHRESEDLDFFTQREFVPDLLLENFRKKGINFEKIEIAPATVHCVLDGVKVSFFEYGYPVFKINEFENVRIASVLDIAAMKLSAIMGRTEKKDYFDVEEILTHEPFAHIVRAFVDKFGREVDLYHLILSLEYFDDVENSPDPKRTKKTWKEVKEFLSKSSKEFLKVIETFE